MEATALPGRTAAELEAAGAASTAREILQQPALWCEIEALMQREAPTRARLPRPATRAAAPAHRCSLAPALRPTPASASRPRSRARSAAASRRSRPPTSWRTRTAGSCAACLTLWFLRPLGQQPRERGGARARRACLGECAHLVVTCNPQGALYRRAATARNGCALLLPEAANDRGFAMTSSFTGMLLTAATCFRRRARRRHARRRLGARSRAQILPARGGTA